MALFGVSKNKYDEAIRALNQEKKRVEKTQNELTKIKSDSEKEIDALLETIRQIRGMEESNLAKLRNDLITLSRQSWKESSFEELKKTLNILVQELNDDDGKLNIIITKISAQASAIDKVFNDKYTSRIDTVRSYSGILDVHKDGAAAKKIGDSLVSVSNENKLINKEISDHYNHMITGIESTYFFKGKNIKTVMAFVEEFETGVHKELQLRKKSIVGNVQKVLALDHNNEVDNIRKVLEEIINLVSLYVKDFKILQNDIALFEHSLINPQQIKSISEQIDRMKNDLYSVVQDMQNIRDVMGGKADTYMADLKNKLTKWCKLMIDTKNIARTQLIVIMTNLNLTKNEADETLESFDRMIGGWRGATLYSPKIDATLHNMSNSPDLWKNIRGRDVLSLVKKSLSILLSHEAEILKTQEELSAAIKRLEEYYSYNSMSDDLVRLHSFSSELSKGYIKRTVFSQVGSIFNGIYSDRDGLVMGCPLMLHQSSNAEKVAKEYLKILKPENNEK